MIPLEDKERDYRSVIEQLAPILHDLPPRLIAIDGRRAAGKSTLGRYLSGRFNISLVELDLYQLCESHHRMHEVRRIIDLRLYQIKRPVIIEGTFVLEMLASLGMKPAFLIYVERNTGTDAISDPLFETYERIFAPRDNAHFVLTLFGD